MGQEEGESEEEEGDDHSCYGGGGGHRAAAVEGGQRIGMLEALVDVGSHHHMGTLAALGVAGVVALVLQKEAWAAAAAAAAAVCSRPPMHLLAPPQIGQPTHPEQSPLSGRPLSMPLPRSHLHLCLPSLQMQAQLTPARS